MIGSRQRGRMTAGSEIGRDGPMVADVMNKRGIGI